MKSKNVHAKVATRRYYWIEVASFSILIVGEAEKVEKQCT